MNKSAMLLALLVLSGCARATPTATPTPPKSGFQAGRTVSSSELRDIDPADFTPAIPANDVGGICRPMPSPPSLQPGERLLLFGYQFADGSRRSVAVVLDTQKQPTRYSDTRSDARRARDFMNGQTTSAGRGTSISLDFRSMMGMLMNEGDGVDGTMYQVRGAGMLDAPSLGNPRRMIERVLIECGGTS